MNSLYILFALSWIAEREALRNVEHYEQTLVAKGIPVPRFTDDPVFARLITEWDGAHTALKETEKILLERYRSEKAEGTFTVISAQ
jgi:hypothetical protein